MGYFSKLMIEKAENGELFTKDDLSYYGFDKKLFESCLSEALQSEEIRKCIENTVSLYIENDKNLLGNKCKQEIVKAFKRKLKEKIEDLDMIIDVEFSTFYWD